MSCFKNKVILITGASSGIGADAARHLAKLGGKVALVGRDEKNLDAVVQQIKEAGSPTPLKIVADVTKDAPRIVNETIKHFGKLDVLVNNAGINIVKPFLEADIEEFDKIMDTNLRSVVILTKLAVPHLQKTKGNIVNVSSICAMIAFKNMSYYNMSKAALDQFTSCCAVELGPKHIRVNAINPAVIRTPIFGKIGIEEDKIDDFVNGFKALYPVGRVGEVADTSAAIAYLASDVASFITGIHMRVDGGAITAGAF